MAYGVLAIKKMQRNLNLDTKIDRSSILFNWSILQKGRLPLKPDGLVCIASDTILDLEWLKAWSPYWPNRYTESEVIDTWRSIASILSQADIVVPGYGKHFMINNSLLLEILERFVNTR